MSEHGQQWIASTFVEIADHLVEDFDVVDLLSMLAERCAQFVDATEVGFLLADSTGTLQVIGASSEKMESIELFELQNAEGPCLDCYNTGQLVLNQNVSEVLDRWPAFGRKVADAGFGTVHALPMRLRSEIIGAVNLFHGDVRSLSPDEVAITQAFADAATIAIVQERAYVTPLESLKQLQHALEARIVIEQAKGVLSERLQLEMTEAFDVLRRYSRENNRRLSDIALEVADGSLLTSQFATLVQKRID